MKINNAASKSVAIKWDGITLPLRAGTPINIGGNIANDETAIGIVIENVYVRPVVSPTIDIMTAGDVDLAEVEASYGSALSAAAKAAMGGIRFFSKDGAYADDTIAESIAKEAEARNQAIASNNDAVLPWQKVGEWHHGTVIIDSGSFKFDNTRSDEFFHDLTGDSQQIKLHATAFIMNDLRVVITKATFKEDFSGNNTNVIWVNRYLKAKPGIPYIIWSTPSNFGNTFSEFEFEVWVHARDVEEPAS